MNLIELIRKSINNICAKYIEGNIEEEEILPIFYVAGSQTLPPPLSPEEEKLKNVLTQFRYKNELVFVHRNRYFKEELVEYCWNEIQEFAETSDKNDDFNGEDELYSKKYREARENLIKKIEE